MRQMPSVKNILIASLWLRTGQVGRRYFWCKDRCRSLSTKLDSSCDRTHRFALRRLRTKWSLCIKNHPKIIPNHPQIILKSSSNHPNIYRKNLTKTSTLNSNHISLGSMTWVEATACLDLRRQAFNQWCGVEDVFHSVAEDPES